MDRRPWWVTVHGVTKEWDTTEHKHKCARKDTRKFPDQQGLRDWRSGPRTLGLWHVDKEETDGFPNHRKDSVKEDAPERQRVRWKWERVKGTHTAYGYESGSDSDTSVKLPWKLVWCFIKEAVRKLKWYTKKKKPNNYQTQTVKITKRWRHKGHRKQVAKW